MSTPFLAEVKIVSFNFAPKGWAQCNGQLLPINQNQALFSLLGTTYGGDGRVNFALPDLRGRIPMSFGGGHVLGERAGEAAHTLIISEMAQHNHFVMTDATTPATSNNDSASNTEVLGVTGGVKTPSGDFPVSLYSTGAPGQVLASQSIGNMGGSQAHNNQQPYLCLMFCIALSGIFPSQT